MKLTSSLVLVLALVIGAGTAVVAQTDSSDSSNQNQTIQGCLQHQGNTFIVTTPDHEQYRVQGKVGELVPHIGQMIAVTGDIKVPAQSGHPVGNEPHEAVGTMRHGAGTIQMNSFQEISHTCNSQ
jgi:hypothetical protein